MSPPVSDKSTHTVTMGLSRLHHPVTVLGHGSRAGIWFQGCSLGCNGCVSRDTWPSATPEEQVPVAEVLEWLAACLPVDGLTISGGEPFDQPEALAALIAGFRSIADPAHADVLVYSGYSAKRLRSLHKTLFVQADAVITGPYLATSPGDSRRGSANQEVHAHTDIGRQRYVNGTGPAGGIQAITAGGQLWMIGIPRSGDMQRLEETLATRGVSLRDVSWRC